MHTHALARCYHFHFTIKYQPWISIIWRANKVYATKDSSENFEKKTCTFFSHAHRRKNQRTMYRPAMVDSFTATPGIDTFDSRRVYIIESYTDVSVLLPQRALSNKKQMLNIISPFD